MKTLRNLSIIISSACLLLTSACDDEPTVTRGNGILVYGSQEVYIGDVNSYTVAIYNENDAYDWTVSGTEASVIEDSGEFLDVAFMKKGEYTINVASGVKKGVLQIEAISKTLSLTGDTIDVSESNEDELVGLPLTIDNVVAGENTIAYTIGGNAVEGVDYELVSPNPLVLTAESEEEAYYVYVRILPDADLENEKYITVTLTSVNSEIEDEVVLSDSIALLTSGVRITDDLVTVAFTDTDDIIVGKPTIIPVEIILSAESDQTVTVNYAFQGTGVSEVSPNTSGTPGTVIFAPGETSQTIYVQISDLAFVGGQEASVTITGITTTDGEVSIDETSKIKLFLIE